MKNNMIKIREVANVNQISSETFSGTANEIDTYQGKIEINKDRLENIINKIIKENPNERRGKTDFELSKALYEMIDITPKDAAERDGFWSALCAIEFKQWIPYRWKNLKPDRWGKRPERNAFASLWWMAKILSTIWEGGEKNFSNYAYESGGNVFLYIIDTRFLKSPIILKNYLLFANSMLSKGWNRKKVSDRKFQKYTTYLNKRLSNLAYECMSSKEVHKFMLECFEAFDSDFEE